MVRWCGVKDGGGTDDQRRLRKKLQNRLNQQARRDRVKGEKRIDTAGPVRPYQVHRWRIEDDDTTIYVSPAKAQKHESASNIVDEPDVMVSRFSATSQDAIIEFTLGADHLLSLIHQNVFRALLWNKYYLAQTATNFRLRTTSDEGEFDPIPCRGSVISVPLSTNTPPSLAPTGLQLAVPHSPWINMIPFPRMRDNLIKWETSFNQSEFLNDLVGHLLDPRTITKEYVPRGAKVPCSTRLECRERDEITAGATGLIITGEPHRVESWEATPGFLAKWTWAVEGCQDLVEVSNTWRLARGEDPIQLSTVGERMYDSASAV
ncbi:hypothetical protein G7046_g9120 [Stylonectria norvegica]|nr:hypothetical protein G7046_g9120 [Stylonectria norvegica]